ncbi:MAG TPA: NAD-dependent dehydratase, partial [Anaerolineaceae bacterium]|nr:NAD-dependent dehydratase [Anaerolineaceae bacterium]
MRILFIGGTGTISSACSELAIKRGYHLTLLNRGKSVLTPPSEAHILQADIRDIEGTRAVLGNYTFDVVVDWVAYTPDHVRVDLDLFRGRMGQYVFISSASAYQTPPSNLPIRESTLLDNPIWDYSRNKIACEELLVNAYRVQKVPFTIVRPSHTYDRSSVPVQGGYTVIDRMLKHQQVIVPGDGTSIWTLTHNADFAKGFIGLLGNSHAIGEAFHITSDEWLTWNQIYQTLAQAAGVEPRLVHIPSDLVAAYDPDIGASLLGDKSHSAIFDNSKIKQVVPDFCASIPFSRGAEEIIAWHREDPSRQGINPGFNAL